MISLKRAKYIQDLAEEVANEFCPSGKVSPETIADASGLTFSIGNYGDSCDGMLCHTEGHFHIFLNIDRLGYLLGVRARFTFAHEIGHYYLDEHRIPLSQGKVPPHSSIINEYSKKNLAEHEADLFAASLLMPKSRLVTKIAEVANGLRGIEAIAKYFVTSWPSTALRYTSSNVIPCALIRWNHSGILWKAVNNSFWRKLGMKSTTRFEPMRESATHESIVSVSNNVIFDSSTLSSFWFNNIYAGGRCDIILKEEAVRMGSHGGITVLTPI